MKIALFSWALASALAFSAPALPPGTEPLYVSDPVLPAGNAIPEGFGCFGACGPSCDCSGKEEGTATTCAEGLKCVWKTVSCLTHSFCRWHDGCYRSCDYQYPGNVGDGSVSRRTCYRGCDWACVDGEAPEVFGGWTINPPGPPPEALGMFQCLARLFWGSAVDYDGTITYAGQPKCAPDPECGNQ